jgi:murein DD-endopeptidase MepM/ murein hydrolase activator NlpD
MRAAVRGLLRPARMGLEAAAAVLRPVRQRVADAAGGLSGACERVKFAVLRRTELVQDGAVSLSQTYRLHRERHPVRRGTLAVTMLAAMTLVFCFTFFGVGLEVFLGGQSIGYISSQQEFTDAVANVTQRVGAILDRPYLLNPDVRYEFTLVTRHELFNREDVERQLFRQISEVKNLYVLTVDGEVVGGTASRNALQGVLDELLAEYPRESHADRVGFQRDVQIERRLVAAEWERTPEQVRTLLNTPLRRETRHISAQGDTWDSVATQYGMTADILRAQNGAPPSMELSAGLELLITPEARYLPVTSIKRTFAIEPVAYATELVADPKMYEGDSEVLTQGVNGEMQIMADVSLLDGRRVGEEEVGRVMLTAPINEVIAVGAKPRPPKYPTETFIRPYNGRLSATGFGMRYLFGRWAMHEGIDISGPTGDPIVASDGGWVSYVGWRNGYGNTVVITHLDGLSTLYGHCSELLVQEGQAVAQGEKIALVGNTGRSTGPHLHFEVRVNNIPKDPMPYLNLG